MRNIIKKILKEETDIPLRVRRRLPQLEKIFIEKVENYYKPDSLKRFENGDELLEVISNSAIDTIYHESLSNYEVFSNEWEKIWTYMKNYLKDKFEDEINTFYRLNVKD